MGDHEVMEETKEKTVVLTGEQAEATEHATMAIGLVTSLETVEKIIEEMVEGVEVAHLHATIAKRKVTWPEIAMKVTEEIEIEEEDEKGLRTALLNISMWRILTYFLKFVPVFCNSPNKT